MARYTGYVMSLVASRMLIHLESQMNCTQDAWRRHVQSSSHSLSYFVTRQTKQMTWLKKSSNSWLLIIYYS